MSGSCLIFNPRHDIIALPRKYLVYKPDYSTIKTLILFSKTYFDNHCNIMLVTVRSRHNISASSSSIMLALFRRLEWRTSGPTVHNWYFPVFVTAKNLLFSNNMNVIIVLLLSIVLVIVVLLLAFSKCFCVRRSAEHYRMCAKLPSMPRGYMADLKLGFRHATLKPRGWYILFNFLISFNNRVSRFFFHFITNKFITNFRDPRYLF